ncbi:MAG: DUF3604 domain-containing protein [marine benthic group bacterium]|nr:DUF3604 domain-containing protein [Gemmatimonadota bacterium]MCL7976721.1 DUF3604 domain-containing protein [Gemmatimonadota bacterium]MCL7980287.1 DUF3604 domain-containing protein [Gemmatimonadota bacterium]
MTFLSTPTFVLVSSVAAVLIAAAPLAAQEPEIVVTEEDFEGTPDYSGEQTYSPFADREYPDQVLFGDTHLHTELSPDAGLLGTTLDLHDAYRFARGETVVSNTGQRVQLVRPLDFLAVTDHAEYIGLATMVREADPNLLEDDFGAWLHERFTAGPAGVMEGFGALLVDAATGTPRFDSPEAAHSIWNMFIDAAETYNEPGRFTALTGFEWTVGPNGNNLHRVVIFGDGPERTGQVLPYGTFDTQDPEDLWRYLERYEDSTNGTAIAIPHNGNLSNGRMFTKTDVRGNPMTRAYAEARNRWEPLHEMSQIKGDEETHPFLSPEDEFADYETWDVSNLDGSAPKTKDMLQYEYARSALRLGLELGAELGVNPYKFGMSAASDSHTGLATTREDNYFGKYTKTEPSPIRHNSEVIPASDPALRVMTSQEVASGLVAVWARENTRDEILGAMKRKEVYATTGTRIRVRMFAGWDFEPDDVSRPDFASLGYARGVPMGGDLKDAPSGTAPTFLIRALRDPDGANLDRIQVIKGWLDANGETHEQVYDVAASDGRYAGADGRVRQPVGSTVDVGAATYTNTIGEPFLAASWTDPEFDPDESAFYYVRVLEIPTPRWTTYDAAFFGIELPDTVPTAIQDRAYTSPVWYTP